MLATVAVLSLLQAIEPTPHQAEVGTSVYVEARAADGAPLVGLAVVAVLPDGEIAELGATDGAGRVSFVPTRIGSYRLEAETGSVRLLAPFHAVAAPRRWLIGLPLGLLGALLFWRNWLEMRRDREPAATR